jgi:hypothetical protein
MRIFSAFRGFSRSNVRMRTRILWASAKIHTFQLVVIGDSEEKMNRTHLRLNNGAGVVPDLASDSSLPEPIRLLPGSDCRIARVGWGRKVHKGLGRL